jgi:hypothetical protein
MNFLHYQVATGTGSVIRVSLIGNAANVLVMDDANFNIFKQGGRYTYFGGYYTRTPVLIKPPSPGRWNVVVNLGGAPGTVKAVVQVVG